ncbi:uncharacterized protein KY384_004481 [Bacidia gigantensis]|uniref:uncharacterized protein n=1 Tax=Bacidia gigantensis TaxID=2732470 RepID=UPI001D0365EE|nr:uncharacterized protein KY384_004481 [Bacidia gigantensis]KAG8531124.1 hypothetical protein KY384_004481 [Bacidia gigantensis]
MSDSEPTTPKKGPPPPESTDTDAPDSDAKPRSRSRSAARRQRRQKAQKSAKASQKEKQAEMPPPEEDPEAEEAEATAGAMQPFEHIGPDSTSMDGPVTYSRAQRGEIPMREGNPNTALKTGNPAGAGAGDMQPASQVGQMAQQGNAGESDLMKQEGLKLRLELNLDIELELKAKIYGDLTLALL